VLNDANPLDRVRELAFAVVPVRRNRTLATVRVMESTTGLEALGSTVSTLMERLERVETELALRRLVYDYCIGVDHRDADRWNEVWTEDAVWETGPEPERVYRGRAAIREAVEQQWATFSVMQHATSNHTLEYLGRGTATGRCDAVVMVQLPDEQWLVGGGAYEDEYRCEGAKWRIARRRVVRPFDLGPFSGLSSRD
jgi:3-phenylpropionate/cinnamic acid dioxygenase small subunit